MAVREDKWGQLCLSGEPFAKAVDNMPHHVNENFAGEEGLVREVQAPVSL